MPYEGHCSVPGQEAMDTNWNTKPFVWRKHFSTECVIEYPQKLSGHGLSVPAWAGGWNRWLPDVSANFKHSHESVILLTGPEQLFPRNTFQIVVLQKFSRITHLLETTSCCPKLPVGHVKQHLCLLSTLCEVKGLQIQVWLHEMRLQNITRAG